MSEPVVKVRKSSEEWREVAAWADWHLAKYRRLLESESVPADKVAGLRGRIAQLKALLSATEEDQHHANADPATD